MALFKKDKKTKDKPEDTQVKTAAKQPEVSAVVPEGLDWVVIQPRITEKTAVLMEQNKYTFDVHPKANRSQVKAAVAKIYNVHPTQVNLIKQDSRMTRRRGRKVMDRGYKKAIVTLPKKESIELV